MFIIRLDLDEISAKTQKHQILYTKFVIKSSFSKKAKFVGDLVQDPRRRFIVLIHVTWLRKLKLEPL